MYHIHFHGNFEHPTNKQKLNFCGLPLDIDVSQFIFTTIHFYNNSHSVILKKIIEDLDVQYTIE